MRRVVLFALLIIAAAAQLDAASVGEWREDIERIVADIRVNHPAPFTKCGELTFLRRVAALEEALPALTEEQRIVGMMRIVALLGDGHTQLAPRQKAFGYWYPVRIYEFSDGVFVTAAHRSVADLAGSQLLEVAGRPVGEVLERARELMGADNALDRRERLFAFHSAALMKGLGFAAADGSLRIKVRLATGAVAERTLQARVADNPRYEAGDSTFEWEFRRELFGPPAGADSEWVSAFRGITAEEFRKEDSSRPPHLQYPHRFAMRAIPERDAFYIQEGQTSDAMLPQFEKALAAIDQQHPRRLIVDLRYNFGGDGSHVAQLLRQFVRRGDAPPWKELYVLSGRKTFSAGLMTLAAFLDNTQATIVGEPAGAALNSYGDPVERIYARTGLVLNVSTARHQLAPSRDLREYVPVDVPAEFTFVQWAKGEDPAVDAILRGDEMRSIAIIARTDGGAAARRTYEDRRRRFGTIPWWSPPAEIDLRNACEELLDAKRFADATETCRLNADIHPFVWNSWYNLAHTQLAAGEVADALGSFRRVLELDPTNFNGEEIHEALERGLRPAVLRFGEPVERIRSSLDGQCASMRVRKIDPPFLDNVRHEQMQIDCEGFSFFGKPRHAEFVFRDDSLQMAWIMTDPGEASALEKAFTDVYGAPSAHTPKAIVFRDARVAIRLDRPEVLFYSEGVDGDVAPDFR